MAAPHYEAFLPIHTTQCKIPAPTQKQALTVEVGWIGFLQRVLSVAAWSRLQRQPTRSVMLQGANGFSWKNAASFAD